MELVKFTVNEWSYDVYPETETFDEWMSDEKLDTYFRNSDWCVKNKLAVVWGIVDQSVDFCVIAPREWVENNCPEILGSRFERPLDEKVNWFGTPFPLEYEDYIGTYLYVDNWDYKTQTYDEPYLERMTPPAQWVKGDYDSYYDGNKISVKEVMEEYLRECQEENGETER